LNKAGEKFQVYPEFYNLLLTIELVDDILAFVLIPCARIVGFLLNALTIRTI
jgi:hypothetical protein